MARQQKTAVAELAPAMEIPQLAGAGFDYFRLLGELADQVRKAAMCIRECVKTTLVHLIEVGQDLNMARQRLKKIPELTLDRTVRLLGAALEEPERKHRKIKFLRL